MDDKQLEADIENVILTWSSNITGEPRTKLSPSGLTIVTSFKALIKDREAKLLQQVGTAGAHACYCAYSVNDCSCALTDTLRESKEGK